MLGGGDEGGHAEPLFIFIATNANAIVASTASLKPVRMYVMVIRGCCCLAATDPCRPPTA